MGQTYQEQIKELDRQLTELNNKRNRLKKSEKEYKIWLMKQLPVGQCTPCRAMVLEDSKSVAVHVWVEKSSEQNQLHIVKLEGHNKYNETSS